VPAGAKDHKGNRGGGETSPGKKKTKNKGLNPDTKSGLKKKLPPYSGGSSGSPKIGKKETEKGTEKKRHSKRSNREGSNPRSLL